MRKQAIRFVQEKLNANGLDAGPVDGILGPKTLEALGRVETIPANFSKIRKAVAFIQLLATESGIEAGSIDGYWGPQTEFAFGELRRKLAGQPEPIVWRPEDLPDENPNGWPSQTPEQNLAQFYGRVGENQTSVQLPYPHKLAWKLSDVMNSFSCHERVADSIQKVLTRVLDYYGLDEIRRLRLDIWGGCLNVRKMRGGSRYSTHSWGIALDYDPERNKLNWGRDRAALARPEYDTWWRLWEEEGWVSLGRQRNFDWMHVQAARL